MKQSAYDKGFSAGTTDGWNRGYARGKEESVEAAKAAVDEQRHRLEGQMARFHGIRALARALHVIAESAGVD